VLVVIYSFLKNFKKNIYKNIGGYSIRYFGGKSKIANSISEYINKLIDNGGIVCNILEENKRFQNTSQSTLTLHTHTHTLCRTFLWSM
jgi:hypothetical protein